METLFKERQEKLNKFLERINKKGYIEKKDIPDDMFIYCNSCNSFSLKDDFVKNNYVCNKCNKHFFIPVVDRIKLIADSYKEILQNMKTKDNGFYNYKEKLTEAINKCKSNEAIRVYEATINEKDLLIAIMDKDFLMGSMGYVVGEKICKMFELATEKNLPVVIFSASGGARMQEGIISLMQMAKTTSAIAKYKELKLPYICVITNPTYGGVSASFVTLADILIIEKDAYFGFAGKRVIENTIKEKLSEDFQSSKKALENGLVDMEVSRNELKQVISDLLIML